MGTHVQRESGRPAAAASDAARPCRAVCPRAAARPGPSRGRPAVGRLPSELASLTSAHALISIALYRWGLDHCRSSDGKLAPQKKLGTSHKGTSKAGLAPGARYPMPSSSLSRSTSNVSSLREALLTRAADALARACAGTVGESAGFGDFEAQPNACANEALRRQVQQALEQIEQRHGERLVVEGKRHRRHECGRVPHTARRRPRASIDLSLAVRNGPTIVRLELAAGLLHRSSPALASSIAQGYGAGPIRHYQAHMQAAHRVLPPHATAPAIGSSPRLCVRRDRLADATPTTPDGSSANCREESSHARQRRA